MYMAHSLRPRQESPNRAVRPFRPGGTRCDGRNRLSFAENEAPAAARHEIPNGKALPKFRAVDSGEGVCPSWSWLRCPVHSLVCGGKDYRPVLDGGTIRQGVTRDGRDVGYPCRYAACRPAQPAIRRRDCDTRVVTGVPASNTSGGRCARNAVEPVEQRDARNGFACPCRAPVSGPENDRRRNAISVSHRRTRHLRST